MSRQRKLAEKFWGTYLDQHMPAWHGLCLGQRKDLPCYINTKHDPKLHEAWETCRATTARPTSTCHMRYSTKEIVDEVCNFLVLYAFFFPSTIPAIHIDWIGKSDYFCMKNIRKWWELGQKRSYPNNEIQILPNCTLKHLQNCQNTFPIKDFWQDWKDNTSLTT